MTHINRREYLKRMAVGAAAIAGTQLDVFGQHPRHRRTRRQETKRPEATRRDPSILNWNITNDPPKPDAFVTAIFAGLMAFSYDSRPAGVGGVVGFHAGHSNNHDLKVKIYNYPACTLYKEVEIKPSTKTISLQVMPTSTRPVDYYQYPTEIFDRFSGSSDPNWLRDFRWLPDLDGPDFYPDRYPKHNDHFKRWLNIKNATFYTRMRTNTKFNLVTQVDDLTKPNQLIKPYGYVARYMAAAMPLPAGGQYVALQVDNLPPIPLDPGADGKKQYQIVFVNECKSKNCKPELGDLDGNDERLRSDLHFARKAMKLPNGRVRIALKRTPGEVPADKPNFCDDDLSGRNTDAAPCMGAGYGGGNGPCNC